MVDVVQQPQLKWSVGASLCLHAAVFTYFLINFSRPGMNVPIGVELRYAPEAAVSTPQVKAKPRVKSAPVVAEKSEVPVVKAEPAAAAAEPISEVIPLSGPVGAADGQQVSPFERYKFELRMFLQSRLIYPQVALRLRQKGVVTLQFTVDAQGKFSDVLLVSPSQFEILNNAALELVRQAPKFKPLPADVSASSVKFSYPIEYTL